MHSNLPVATRNRAFESFLYTALPRSPIVVLENKTMATKTPIFLIGATGTSIDNDIIVRSQPYTLLSVQATLAVPSSHVSSITPVQILLKYPPSFAMQIKLRFYSPSSGST